MSGWDIFKGVALVIFVATVVWFIWLAVQDCMTTSPAATALGRAVDCT